MRLVPMPASALSVPGMSLAKSFRNGYIWVPGGMPIASAGRRKAAAAIVALRMKVLRERVAIRRNSITLARQVVSAPGLWIDNVGQADQTASKLVGFATRTIRWPQIWSALC